MANPRQNLALMCICCLLLAIYFIIPFGDGPSPEQSLDMKNRNANDKSPIFTDLFEGNWSNTGKPGETHSFKNFNKYQGTIRVRLENDTFLLFVYNGQAYSDGIIQVIKLHKHQVMNYTNFPNNTGPTRIYTFENQSLLLVHQEYFDSKESDDKDCRISGYFNMSNAHPGHKQIGDNAKLEIKIISADCKIDLSSKLVLGTRNIQKKSSFFITFVIILAFIPIFGVFKMLQETLNNGSESLDYSLGTLMWISAWDGYFSFLLLAMGVAFETYFYLYMPAFILFFILFAIFETRLILVIWMETYNNETQDYVLQRRRTARFQCFYYLIIMSIIYFMNRFALNPVFLVINSLVFVPQIVQNAMRGKPVQFNMNYIIYFTLPRYFILFYLRSCPGNILELKPMYSHCVIVLFLLMCQIILLYFQDILGPQFFVPAVLLPKKYNYFVPVSTTDLESGQAEFGDCVICLNPLHMGTSLDCDEKKMNRTWKELLSQNHSNIMQSPCKHKFHSKCLINWMTIKMDCPTCRKQLPPL